MRGINHRIGKRVVFSLALGLLLLAWFIWIFTSNPGSHSGAFVPLLPFFLSLACFAFWWYRKRPGESVTAASIVGSFIVVFAYFLGELLYSRPGSPMVGVFLCFILFLGLIVLALKRNRPFFDELESSRRAHLDGGLPRESRRSAGPTFSMAIGVCFLLLASQRYAQGDPSDSSIGLFAWAYQLSTSLIGPSGPAVLMAALGVTFILYGLLVRK